MHLYTTQGRGWSVSTTAAAQAEDIEQHHRTDHRHDELAQEAGGGQPEESEEESAQDGANPPATRAARQPDPSSLGDLTGQPACAEADEQKPHQVHRRTVRHYHDDILAA